MSEFKKWYIEWLNSPNGDPCEEDVVPLLKLRALQHWNAALEAAAKVCDDADKSTHPADLADMIRALKHTPEQSNES